MEQIHLKNFIASLQKDVNEALDSFIEHQAFVRVAAEWLGFTNLEEDKNFVDGAGDRGVDFWFAAGVVFDIFQVKSHELTKSGDIQIDSFGVEGVKDLQRVVNLLTDENRDIKSFTKLRPLVDEWEHTVTTRNLAESSDEPLHVNLGLILFGLGLKPQASSEFASLEAALAKPKMYRGIPVLFHPRIIAIGDIVDSRWRSSNIEWRDKDGKQRETIDLYPEKLDEPLSYLRGPHHAVFFCRAIDLINAFSDFGYQLFEPNVRAHIEKSKVNAAIRKSLAYASSRKEFQFLNNGATVICSSFTKPSPNKPWFRVRFPGVINGLQTVVALHDSYYDDLTQQEKDDLAQHCYVLVRLLQREAVRDINSVVLASNTQNPMQARNLRSNTSEQVYYEKLFAQQLGWFYERKQGAWDAFCKDPTRWRRLPNFKPSHFRVSVTPGRPRFRHVDNEDAAQAWLSFIGFSNEAVHEKRALFEEDRWYELIFLHRTKRHGAMYAFDPAQAREDWLNYAPAPDMILASCLAREFARRVPLAGKENRQRAMERLGLSSSDSTFTREQVEAQLLQDEDYLLEQVLSGLSWLFVDSLGYLLYRACGDSVHEVGKRLLADGSLAALAKGADFDAVAATVRNEEAEPSDILPVAWYAFRHTLGQLLAGPWRQSYLTARNRTRFNYQNSTRQKVYEQLDNLDRFMTKAQLTQPWAAGIPAKTGLYSHFASLLCAP